MALDLRYNLASAQNLENKLTEFQQILYGFILTRTRLGFLDMIFCTFVP